MNKAKTNETLIATTTKLNKDELGSLSMTQGIEE